MVADSEARELLPKTRGRDWVRSAMPNFHSTVCFCALLLLLPLLGNGCASVREDRAADTQIYDPRADGEDQLRVALATARKEHKRVLLDLGANWCSDSQSMFRLLQTDPAIRQEIRQHFVLAMIDVNQKETPPRNRPLPERLGNPLTRGIPVLLILDAQGTVQNKVAAERLSDESHKQPTQVLAYLQKWASPTP
jgi:thiol:disulfide interchange protein